MIFHKALELLNNQYKEPCFVSFHKFGRGLISGYLNLDYPQITESKAVVVWQISDENLKQKKHKYNVLFDDENYLIHWQFKYVLNKLGDELEETVFFHWKGTNAPKGYTPLPSEMNGEDPVVERLNQWSEPPVFFHIFQNIVIVLNGKEERFDPFTSRLFMTRGELINEIHLFEVPFESKSLRSRGIFFSVVPKNNKIYSWCGSAVHPEYRDLIMNQIKLIQSLKLTEKKWYKFETVELTEEETNILFEKDKQQNYLSITKVLNYNSRLFYIYFIDEEIFGAEVEYALKSAKCTSFPFLQTHLYSATQPAIFLLDNGNEIWLWKGHAKDTDQGLFDMQFRLAKELVSMYCKEKGKMFNSEITVKYAIAESEPIEFTNIFPVWKHNM